MVKIIMLLLLPYITFASTIDVDYRVEFGILGEIGKVHTRYTQISKVYTIDTNLSAVGIIAKSATDNLRERHICKGYIDKNKQRITTSYRMIKHYGVYRSMTLYSVDIKSKKIIKSYKKWLIRKHKSERKIQDYTYALNYYGVDDMVSLFLNLSYKIQDKYKPKHYRYKVIGADRQNGNVDITIPSKTRAKNMSQLVGAPKKGEWLMNLVMHRQLYGSKQGELMVRMGKDSIIQKAVLKDLIFFGDVRIIRQ